MYIMEMMQMVDIKLIDRPVPPVRIDFNEEEIQSLTESVRQNGILVPLLCRKKGVRYEIIDGDRRLECAWRCRLAEVPVMVRDSDDRQTHVLRMLANLDRADPDPVSEARYIASAIADTKSDVGEFAHALHKSEKWIEDRLAIAAMPDYLQQVLKNKQLPLGVVLALSQVDDPHTQENWVRSAIISGMSVRGANDALREYRQLRELQGDADADSPPPPMPEVPPIILYPCARCGERGDLTQLQVVRIHRGECGASPT